MQEFEDANAQYIEKFLKDYVVHFLGKICISVHNTLTSLPDIPPSRDYTNACKR
jgi:hypothetical protein